MDHFKFNLLNKNLPTISQILHAWDYKNSGIDLRNLATLNGPRNDLWGTPALKDSLSQSSFGTF